MLHYFLKVICRLFFVEQPGSGTVSGLGWHFHVSHPHPPSSLASCCPPLQRAEEKNNDWADLALGLAKSWTRVAAVRQLQHCSSCCTIAGSSPCSERNRTVNVTWGMSQATLGYRTIQQAFRKEWGLLQCVYASCTCNEELKQAYMWTDALKLSHRVRYSCFPALNFTTRRKTKAVSWGFKLFVPEKCWSKQHETGCQQILSDMTVPLTGCPFESNVTWQGCRQTQLCSVRWGLIFSHTVLQKN